MTAPGAVAMITGANRGIGAAIAKALGDRGYRLALGLRDPATLPDDLAAFEPLVVRYDAARAEAARGFTDAVEDAFGRIDVLINNAGIGGPLEIMPEAPQSDDAMEAVLEDLLTINVKAPFRLTRTAMPALCRGGRGRVIVLASLSGKRVLGLNAGYQMTKHAVLAPLARGTPRGVGPRRAGLCSLPGLRRHRPHPAARSSTP